MSRLAKRLFLAGLSIGALAAANGAPANALTHSFEGSCAIIGVAELVKPLTVLPSPNHVVFRARGTCSGTLDGRRLPAGGAPVALNASGDKLTGCTGTVVPKLTYSMRFPRSGSSRSTEIHGTAQVTFAGRNSEAVVHGATSGVASATGTIQGGKELLEDCAAGRLRSIGISMDLLTITPLVSEDSAARARARQESAGQELRLSVRPRRVRAGRRVRVRFRATALRAGRRRAVRGATIRFAGRRVRTNRRGRASLVVRLRRAGARRVLASAPGGAGGAVTIHVVRPRRR